MGLNKISSSYIISHDTNGLYLRGLVFWIHRDFRRFSVHSGPVEFDFKERASDGDLTAFVITVYWVTIGGFFVYFNAINALSPSNWHICSYGVGELGLHYPPVTIFIAGIQTIPWVVY
jgi:hypothetical protein